MLPHVETQAVYLGADWSNSSQLLNFARSLDRYDNFLVHSRYMDMLAGMGYHVGRGTSDGGVLDSVDLDKRYYLNDSDIQDEIQSLIDDGSAVSPDEQRLYVIYVEPGVVVRMSNGGMR